MTRIVVGVDRSDASAAALHRAVNQARRADASLLVLHAHLTPLARGRTPSDADVTVEPALAPLTPFVDAASGLASVAPPLHDVTMAFGLLQIVWFVWLGVVLVTNEGTTVAADRRATVEGGTTGSALRGQGR